MIPRRLSIPDVQNLVRDPVQAARAIESLLLTLASDDLELCAWASDALQGIEHFDSKAAKDIEKYCMHEAAPVAVWACNLIGRLGAEGSPFQARVAEALTEHPQLGVRQQAAAALGKMSGLSRETIEELELAADSDDPRLKHLAATTLDRHKAA